MKSAPLSRRDRLRHILADLRMPGALEALDAILQGVDGGALTAPEAIEQLLSAQIQLRNNRRRIAACSLVTIRGNSYRMRQHTELWQALHAPPEPESASRRRRSARQEVPTA